MPADSSDNRAHRTGYRPPAHRRPGAPALPGIPECPTPGRARYSGTQADAITVSAHGDGEACRMRLSLSPSRLPEWTAPGGGRGAT